jgi:hypothetical protein
MDQDMPSPVQFGAFDGGDTGTGVGGVGGITVEAVFMWGPEMAFAIDGVYDSGFGGIFDGPFPAANSVVVDMVCEHFDGVRGGRSIVLYMLWESDLRWLYVLSRDKESKARRFAVIPKL